MNDFLFPASRVVKLLRNNSGMTCNIYCSLFAFLDVKYSEQLSQGICNSTDSTLAAYKCINALCKGCLCNVELLKDILFDLFYSGKL